jgi:hypothetical protein
MPWITGNIHISSCGTLQTIKHAKRHYRIKIESYYTGSDARRMWQGLKTITDYNWKPSGKLPNDVSLQDELNAI